MHRVLMNYDLYNGFWWVHFIEADCRTPIGRRTRYLRFARRDDLDSFVNRCRIEDRTGFEADIRRWGRGSSYANLTEEQYEKLKTP